MTEADEFISTKEVLPWRAEVYKRAARRAGKGVKVQKKAGSGEIIIQLDDNTLESSINVVAQGHIAVEISGPKSQQQTFSKMDRDLLRRINYRKLTFNPLLLPFVWQTRNQRRKEEKPLQARSRRRLG